MEHPLKMDDLGDKKTLFSETPETSKNLLPWANQGDVERPHKLHAHPLQITSCGWSRIHGIFGIS